MAPVEVAAIPNNSPDCPAKPHHWFLVARTRPWSTQKAEASLPAVSSSLNTFKLVFGSLAAFADLESLELRLPD